MASQGQDMVAERRKYEKMEGKKAKSGIQKPGQKCQRHMCKGSCEKLSLQSERDS